MAKVKISEFDVNPDNNTDINSINIAEGCAPSGINNAIRQLMSDLKAFQTGADGDPFNGAVNGTVGATTPASGAFTTLSASSTATLNTLSSSGATITGGSINGTTVGASTASTGAFTTLGATGVATFSAGSASAPAITTTGNTNTGIFFPAADTIAFTEGGVESMRIDSSGNLNLGQATSALQSGGTGITLYGSSSSEIKFLNSTTGTSATDGIAIVATGGNFSINNREAGAITFGTNNSERIKVDSSGNVGIGTSNPAEKLNVSGSGTQRIRITETGSGLFTQLVQSSTNTGIVASSTSSDNFINFSTTLSGSSAERMRITSAGDVGIGTSSPVAPLSVVGNILAPSFNTNTTYTIGIQDAQTNSFVNTKRGNLIIQSSSAVGTANGMGGGDLTLKAGNAYSATAGTEGNVNITAGYNLFSNTIGTGAVIFNTRNAERMRIAADGNVGIGTSNPTGRFEVTGGQSRFSNDVYLTRNDASGPFFGSLNSVPLRLGTGDTERMRIDSSGTVAIGGATNTRQLSVTQTRATNYAGEFVNTNATGSYGVVASVNSSDTTGRYFEGYSSSAAVTRFIVYSNGNVVNTNNSYGAISDIKLKENIVDATPKLEKLNQVRVVNYNLIGEEQKQLGVIAQELEQIFPSMIDESPDVDREGNDLGTTTKQVKYSVFVPMLIKAIQEQQVIINDLKARIETLESK